MKKRPIGIFDSGVGGLTVLKEVEKLLPHEDVIYFGDTARVPYGNKSKSTIVEFSTQNVLFLLRKKVKMVVIACNTSSALALNYLKSVFSIPILGVIEAGAKKSLAVTKNKKIGIIGTKSTIASKSYEKYTLNSDKTLKVYSQPCPLFVPLVEEGILKGYIAEAAIKMYLKQLKNKGIDSIILGCTHYPLLKPQIGRYLKGVTIIDSAKEVAIHTRNLLKNRGLLNDGRKRGRVDFYVTDEPKGFMRSAKLFLKRDISKPRVVHV